MALYLKSTKPGSDMKFRIVSYNKETQKGRIVGTMGKEFGADMSKDALRLAGYSVVNIPDEVPDAQL